MLRPDSRSHLMELLRPPPGYKFDQAIGTTFSLDLMSALILPLSFVFFDWERDETEQADPLALLEALRLNGDRFSIFCQSGNIRIPGKYSPLLTFLEPCIHEVQTERAGGVFHPKVWVVRYKCEDGPVKYRVLCLSRNLTFDRSWDTVVALDGELIDRERAIAANRPLSEFITALPGLCIHPLASHRRKNARSIADELLRVRFKWPDDFEDSKCRFWTSGLTGKRCDPFGEKRDQSLIVSPFLSDSVIRDFVETCRLTHLVSRPESLQEISPQTLMDCKSIHFLCPQLSGENTEEYRDLGLGEVLDGLHAKLFVIDRGWSSSVFSGSFNATNSALDRNVEFMVEMVGKRSKVGVERFLSGEKGVTHFADLLQNYDVNGGPMAVDPLRQQFDDLFLALKRKLIDGRPNLTVSAEGQEGLFDVCLRWTNDPMNVCKQAHVKIWPITLPEASALPISSETIFRSLSHEALTPLIAISIQCEIGTNKRESSFVLNLPLKGAPDDRQDRVVANLLQRKEQLLRYILFLLAAGDEDAASSGALAALLQDEGASPTARSSLPNLMETMLRALHRGPAQLERVASLLDTLKRCGKGADFIGPEFQSIWEPIWEAARKTHSKP